MRIVVIGGGASGVVTAIMAKNSNNEVIVLEKNDKPLKKLLLTGNGRCNYLHEDYEKNKFHSQDMEFIDDYINHNNIQDVRYFFDSIGIIPKNKNGYIYPTTNQAVTIYDALIRKALEVGVIFQYNANVLSIKKNNNGFIVETEEKLINCKSVVLATGGCAYPKTGSTGDGYRFLKNLGHTIIKPLPALVQLLSDDAFLKDWDGVRTDVVLTLLENGKEISTERGEVQLTKYGISGICTFNLSQYVTRGLDNGLEEIIHINFVPFIETLLTTWLERYSKNNSYKNIKELLEGFINKKIVPIVLKCCGLKDNLFYKDLDSDSKIRLCNLLKAFPLKITGTKDFDECQVCNGGVSLKEVDMNTMESKLVSGLYIVGELLDISGDCGGYNLTNCWISGIIAGRSLGGISDTSSTD